MAHSLSSRITASRTTLLVGLVQAFYVLAEAPSAPTPPTPRPQTLEDSYAAAREIFRQHAPSLPPSETRLAIVETFKRAFDPARGKIEQDVHRYVQTCADVSGMLMTYDMCPERHILAHKIISPCLPLVDAVPIQLAMTVLRSVDVYHDENGKRVQPSLAAECRLRHVERLLSLWRRIVTQIDPTWKADNPENLVTTPSPRGGNYPAGIDPQAVTEPDIRKEYEERIARNYAKAERNIRESGLRLHRDHWRTMALMSISHTYREGITVSDDEARRFRALTIVFVQDTRFRAELLKAASIPAGSE